MQACIPPPHPPRCPVLGLAHPRAGRVRSDPGLGSPPTTTTTQRGARDDAWRLRLRRHKEAEERAQRWRELLQQQQARRTRVVVVAGGGRLGGEKEGERTLPGQKGFLSFSCEHHVGNDIVISVFVFFLGVAAWVRVRTCNY
jgi:hypothetical protein